MLIARLFLTLPLVCPNCGADMRIIAFVTEAAPARRILNHLGEPADLGPDCEALAGLPLCQDRCRLPLGAIV
jgi:hypothetical protein